MAKGWISQLFREGQEDFEKILQHKNSCSITSISCTAVSTEKISPLFIIGEN